MWDEGGIRERKDEKRGTRGRRRRCRYGGKERGGGEQREASVYEGWRESGGLRVKTRGDSGSVSGDVLFKEVSPCLMTLV